MTRTAYDREHERELLKHEPRPTDRLHWRQENAIIKLTGYLDGVIGTGMIPAAIEMVLRERVAEAQMAFNIPTKAERGGQPARVADDISDAEIIGATL
jgi:hypothetical protein